MRHRLHRVAEALHEVEKLAADCPPSRHQRWGISFPENCRRVYFGSGCCQQRHSLSRLYSTTSIANRRKPWRNPVDRSLSALTLTCKQLNFCSRLAPPWIAELTRARWTGNTSRNHQWTTRVHLQNSLRSSRHVSPDPSFRPSCPLPSNLLLRNSVSLLPLSRELRIMASTNQTPLPIATFNSPSKFRSPNPNPFAFGGPPAGSPLKPQAQPRPPQVSFFNPQLQRKPSAPAFRNPAFTTPQRRDDDLVFSEYSGAESSPALTDTSEMPADTPEREREEEDLGKLTLTPAAGRTLFSKTLLRNHASGRGELARGSRDKVRKRKRLQGDKDVGSVRPRLPHDSDDSDSDWEEGSGVGSKPKNGGKAARRGWFNNFLSAVSDHPSAPAILSKWLQLGVNVILLSTVLFGIFAILMQIRSDLSHASEKARAAIANEMSLCAQNFQKNACSRANRPPALDGPCNEWQACMDQDPDAAMITQITAQNVAEIMNAFVGVLTFKTWVGRNSACPVVDSVHHTNYHCHLPGLHRVAFPSRSCGQQRRLWVPPRIHTRPLNSASSSPALAASCAPYDGAKRGAHSSAGLHLGAHQPDPPACSEEPVRQRSY